MAGRLIVVGGVAAGMSAAAKARRVDPDLEVIVYERGEHISYGACGLPYWLGGEIADWRQLIARTPDQMAAQGVQVRLRHEVTAIDAESHTVSVHDREGGRRSVSQFDSLVFATGARPRALSLPGEQLHGVFSLRSLESGLALRRFLHEQKPHLAVIVGGGYLGVEMAEALTRLGLRTTLLVRSDRILRTALDDDMRPPFAAEVSSRGVEVLGESPIGFEGDDRVHAVMTESGRISADMVLVATGVAPEVNLAHESGVALGRSGAIATDSLQQTNLPGIYAAGDCAEALHLVTGKPAYVPLGSTANKQGRVAGSSAAGGRETFGGIVGTTVVRAFGMAAAATGLTAERARAEGWSVRETRIQASDVSHYYPGARELYVKLVVDTASGRLLGAQIVGRPEAVKRIDVLATALHHRLTVSELQRLDLGYAPPFAPAWDPLLVAANVASG